MCFFNSFCPLHLRKCCTKVQHFFEDFMRPLFYEPVISVAAALQIHAALNLLPLAVGNTDVSCWDGLPYIPTKFRQNR